jgi:hypothetical protein
VKGRPRKCRTQGSVERGDAPFKKALHQWIIENPTESCSQFGAYVVNKNINAHQGQNRAQKSPYEICYGKDASGCEDIQLIQILIALEDFTSYITSFPISYQLHN